MYRVKANQGLMIINFNANGYYVLDDHKRVLNAYVENGKVYVDVNTQTRYIYFIKGGNEQLKDKVFTLSFPEDFKSVKYENCEREEELKGNILLNRENNSVSYIYSKREVSTPFYIELEYCYEGEGDNLVLGFFSDSEPNTVPKCHGSSLGGCGKYYSKGSFAIGFDPVYSDNTIVFINGDGECSNLVKIPTKLVGCHTLRLFVTERGLKLVFDSYTQPYELKFPKNKGAIYLSASSGAKTSMIEIKSLRVYEGEVSEVEKVEKAGFNEVEIRNFRGIAYGKLSLDRVNVIIGANNAGKTTILDSVFLLSDFYKRPPGFENALELLAYLHGVKKNNKKFIYRFYNTSLTPVIRGDDITLSIKDENVKPEGEAMSLYISQRLLPRYFKYIKDNWEEISNYSDVFTEIINEVNGTNNEKYITMTLEPFGGSYTFYLIREDKKRVRLRDIGEGVQTYLIVRILYEYLKPSIILWDDIESHLNPLLLGKVIAWFDDIPAQIVVTTHNLQVAKDISKIGKCIAVDIDKEGKLKVKYIDDVEEYLNLGIDPRLLLRMVE